MEEIKVSIVVSIYNVELYLEKCIASLRQQTHSNLEILLVIDGSKDGSLEIAKRLAKKDARLKVLEKENGGLSDARNFGLRFATGKYVIFFDGDDYAKKNFVEELLKHGEVSQAPITVCSYQVETFNEKEEIIETEVLPFIEGIFEKEDFSKIPITNKLVGTLSYAWNKLYRRDFLLKEKLQFQKGLSLIEDITFNATCFEKIPKISFCEASLVHYCQRPRVTLSSSAVYDKPLEMRQAALKRICEFLTSWGQAPHVLKELTGEITLSNVKSHIIALGETSLSFQEKKQQLAKILQKQELQQQLIPYPFKKWKDSLTYYLVKHQYSGMLIRLVELRR